MPTWRRWPADRFSSRPLLAPLTGAFFCAYVFWDLTHFHAQRLKARDVRTMAALRSLRIALALAAVAACSPLSAAQPPSAATLLQTPTQKRPISKPIKPWRVDLWIPLGFNYAPNGKVVSAATFTPSKRRHPCARAARFLGRYHGRDLRAGHHLGAECLHLRFVGPIARAGAIEALPFGGRPLTVLLFAFEFGPRGVYIGGRALAYAPSVTVCEEGAIALVRLEAQHPSLPAVNSLVLVCAPVGPWVRPFKVPARARWTRFNRQTARAAAQAARETNATIRFYP